MPRGRVTVVNKKKGKDAKQDRRIAKIERQIGGLEYKSATFTQNGTLVSNTLLITFMHPFNRGVSSSQILGNKIKIWSIRVTGAFIPAGVPPTTTATVQLCRALMLRMEHNNNVAPIASDILLNSATNGQFAMPNYNQTGGSVGTYLGKKFTDGPINILRDTKNKLRLGYLNTPVAVAGQYYQITSASQPYQPIDWLVRYPSGRIFEVSTNADPISSVDCITGPHYLCLLSNTDSVNYVFQYQITYTDL